ncbi:HTH domain-containing protein [Natrinema amylolyticum]|uniref:HTH domain-containing protein n=1 Tax=Natrinema amylolyticum TaxID=2878679 RepID=UPI001CFBB130|nr:HTH domain-containing protein [Natrinema amylolyticum]
MPAGDLAESPIVPTETQTDLRVDCYVRSTVPGPTAETITAIVNRLQQLCDRGHINTHQLRPWPPERHAVVETDDTRESTRRELVAEFERWAERHGVTLEPAFRRQEIPPSPLGIGSDEPRERVRVPLVALALYEDDPTETETGPETAPLRGVVPYTEQPRTDAARTYTVNEWLTAVGADTGETVTYDSRNDQQPLLERHQ